LMTAILFPVRLTCHHRCIATRSEVRSRRARRRVRDSMARSLSRNCTWSGHYTRYLSWPTSRCYVCYCGLSIISAIAVWRSRHEQCRHLPLSPSLSLCIYTYTHTQILTQRPRLRPLRRGLVIQRALPVAWFSLLVCSTCVASTPLSCATAYALSSWWGARCCLGPFVPALPAGMLTVSPELRCVAAASFLTSSANPRRPAYSQSRWPLGRPVQSPLRVQAPGGASFARPVCG